MRLLYSAGNTVRIGHLFRLEQGHLHSFPDLIVEIGGLGRRCLYSSVHSVQYCMPLLAQPHSLLKALEHMVLLLKRAPVVYDELIFLDPVIL